MKDRIKKFSAVIVILIFWHILSQVVNSPVIVPSIKETFLEMTDIVKSRNFPLLLSSSCLRAVSAFFVSILIGMISGISAAFFEICEIYFDMISGFFSSVPTVAIILLILIWFKADAVTVIVSVLMVFPIIYKNVKSCIQNYDKNIILMMDLYKVGFFKRLFKVFLPKIFIDLSPVIPTAFLINFKMVIAGEVLSQPKYAIGTAMSFEKAYLNTKGVFAYIVIIIVISKIIETVIKKLVDFLNKKRFLNV